MTEDEKAYYEHFEAMSMEQAEEHVRQCAKEISGLEGALKVRYQRYFRLCEMLRRKHEH